VNRAQLVIAAVAVLVVGIGALRLFSAGSTSEGGGKPMVSVTVPELTNEQKLGKATFDENCATCHGDHASGRDGSGPPLVHRIYEPGHHADISFRLAVRNGVRAHHWRFGNMPPVSGVSPDDIGGIVSYVRALQRANGIE